MPRFHLAQARAMERLLSEAVEDFGVRRKMGVEARSTRVPRVSSSGPEQSARRNGGWERKLLVEKEKNVELMRKLSRLLGMYESEKARAEKAELQLSECEEKRKTGLKSHRSAEQEKSLRDQFSCSICYDILYEPINLPKCNHKFCRLCFVQLALHSSERGEITRCPQCRVTEPGVDFPIDTTVWGAVQLLFPKLVHDRKKNWFQYMSGRSVEIACDGI